MISGYFKVPLDKINFQNGRISFYVNENYIVHPLKLSNPNLNKLKFDYYYLHKRISVGFTIKNALVIQTKNLDEFIRSNHNMKNKYESDNGLYSKINNKKVSNTKNKSEKLDNLKLSNKFNELIVDYDLITFKDKEIDINIGNRKYSYLMTISNSQIEELKDELKKMYPPIKFIINDTQIKNYTDVYMKLYSFLDANKTFVGNSKTSNNRSEEIDQISNNSSEEIGQIKTRHKFGSITQFNNEAENKEFERNIEIKNKDEVQTEIIQLTWKNINFIDNRIFIKFIDIPVSFFEIRSKNEYNLIKPFFEKRKIEAPKLEKSGDNYKILDLNNFFNHIALGKLIYDLTIKADESKIPQLYNYINAANLNNIDILNYFSESRNDYIKYLALIHNPVSKIIPIFEVSIDSSSNKKLHFSFIFTIKKGPRIYLIWESTGDNKATYLFGPFSEANFDLRSKKLQSFILTDDIHNKRSRLRSREREITSKLGYNCSLNHHHEGFKLWKSKLVPLTQ